MFYNHKYKIRIIVSRKVTRTEKLEIKELFINGKSIKDISTSYDFSVQTITRQLKDILGENDFKKIKKNTKSPNSFNKTKEVPAKRKVSSITMKKNIENKEENFGDNSDQEIFVVLPLDENVNIDEQKDISSRPISEVNFPKMLFMIIKNEFELETKLLKDYPEWNFLPNEDLKRKTIQIFSEKKIAKLNCRKDQKLLQVPNPRVLLLASKNLRNKGITRIVFDDLLLSL